MKNKKMFPLIFICCALLLGGCSNTKNNNENNQNNSSTSATQNSASATETNKTTNTASDDDDDMFTSQDKEIGYDEQNSTIIELNGSTAKCSSNAVKISDNTITISDEGTYIISGTLDDGTIIVDADDTDKTQIVLNNATIHSKTSAPIYVRSADKVFITTANGSKNTLSNSGEYTQIDDNNIDSVIFSKDDLTLNGSGALTISTENGHGVVSKDDLVVTCGDYNITATGHGLSGKDSVRIADGNFKITSGKDGIHAENADDASEGFMYLAGGTFDITASGDGLSAENYLKVEDGKYTLLTGGGSTNASQKNDDFMGRGFEAQTETSDDTTSTKAVKATGDITINGGTFEMNSADDALHSNANLTVNNGSFNISAGDDGAHADSKLSVTNGTINITTSYEGLEGTTIDISNGNITLVASDDGLNAAGGNDQSGFERPDGMGGRMDNFASDSSSDSNINISGGTLNINASGDGIDSNGNITISGGNIFVSGPENDGNASLDYGIDATITGGTFISAGSSGMAQNFGSSSTQCTMMVTVDSQSAGSTITLTDSNGKEIISWNAEKSFNSVIISTPEITKGSEYTLKAGNSETTITMEDTIYGSSNGMGGMGGMGGGGMQNPPQNNFM